MHHTWQELRQERTARAQLQQQLWEREAVTQLQILAPGHDASPTSVQTARATIAAATAALPCPPRPAPSTVQGPSTWYRATEVHNAAVAAAEPAASSSRRELLQELQQAPDMHHLLRASTTAGQQQQQQQGSPYSYHQNVLQPHENHINQQQRQQRLKPADDPNQQHSHQHHQQQQQSAMQQLLQQHQGQYMPRHQPSTAAARPEAPVRTPNPTAVAYALPHARSGGPVVQQQQDSIYDFSYPPPRVATPHLRPTAPAVAITPLTNLGCSSNGRRWSTPASRRRSSSSQVSTTRNSRSRGSTGAAATTAALLSHEAALVLSSAAAARDRNSLQLLMDSLGSSSSDSEVEDSSNRPSVFCNMGSQQLPKCPATAPATAAASDNPTEPNMNHHQYQRSQRQTQQQWHGTSSLPSVYCNAPAAAASSVKSILLQTADAEVHESLVASVATELTKPTKSMAIDVQSPSWDQEIETFCSMLDGLHHRKGVARTARAQPGLLQMTSHMAAETGQQQQFYATENQLVRTSKCNMWQEDVQLHMPQPKFPHHQERLQQSRLAAACETQWGVVRQYAGDRDIASSAKAIAAASEPPKRRSGVVDRTSSGCRNCAALQEQLLECDFERELAIAQLAVVREEREVLALQHQLLMESIILHQAHR